MGLREGRTSQSRRRTPLDPAVHTIKRDDPAHVPAGTSRQRSQANAFAKCGLSGLWCVNQAEDVRRPLGTFSGDALRHRHTEPSHPVEHRAADPGFGFLGRQSPGAQATTDDGLVAGYGGFRK